LKNNKKVKIHVKNNHWAPGSFPTDAEGEKNFTITKDDFDRALEKFPEVKEKIEIFIDWDEENFNSSMANSDILLTWNFPTSNLKKIAPNLKWIHCVSAGVEHLLPLDWMLDGLVLTNSSGVHSKKAGEYGLMSVLMLQNHMTKIITNQKSKKFISLFSNPIAGKTIVVVGTGSLGSSMIKLVAPLGANIIGVNRKGRTVEGCSKVVNRQN
jgi:phosphoglycerate dehydrogenase-like enzyme